MVIQDVYIMNIIYEDISRSYRVIFCHIMKEILCQRFIG